MAFRGMVPIIIEDEVHDEVEGHRYWVMWRNVLGEVVHNWESADGFEAVYGPELVTAFRNRHPAPRANPALTAPTAPPAPTDKPPALTDKPAEDLGRPSRQTHRRKMRVTDKQYQEVKDRYGISPCRSCSPDTITVSGKTTLIGKAEEWEKHQEPIPPPPRNIIGPPLGLHQVAGLEWEEHYAMLKRQAEKSAAKKQKAKDRELKTYFRMSKEPETPYVPKPTIRQMMLWRQQAEQMHRTGVFPGTDAPAPTDAPALTDAPAQTNVPAHPPKLETLLSFARSWDKECAKIKKAEFYRSQKYVLTPVLEESLAPAARVQSSFAMDVDKPKEEEEQGPRQEMSLGPVSAVRSWYASDSQQPTESIYVAFMDYTPNYEDELELVRGNLVAVLGEDEQNPGWVRARIYRGPRAGTDGLVWSAYLMPYDFDEDTRLSITGTDMDTGTGTGRPGTDWKQYGKERKKRNPCHCPGCSGYLKDGSECPGFIDEKHDQCRTVAISGLPPRFFSAEHGVGELKRMLNRRDLPPTQFIVFDRPNQIAFVTYGTQAFADYVVRNSAVNRHGDFFGASFHYADAVTTGAPGAYTDYQLQMILRGNPELKKRIEDPKPPRRH